MDSFCSTSNTPTDSASIWTYFCWVNSSLLIPPSSFISSPLPSLSHCCSLFRLSPFALLPFVPHFFYLFILFFFLSRCWIIHNNNVYRLLFFVPFVCYVLISVVILCYITYKIMFKFNVKMYTKKYPQYAIYLLFIYFSVTCNRNEKKDFIFQLIKYVIIFVIFWTPVVITRLMQIADIHNTSIFVVLIFFDC